MKIVSCNIRFHGGNDKANHWKHRKEIFIEIISKHSPQILCFQEMWYEQFLDIQSAFPHFESCVMVDETTSRNPLNTISYDINIFNKISSGGYWLSENPHITGSISWNSSKARYVNWVRLEIINSKKDFRVINTHLDHKYQKVRENQVKLINEDACAYPEEYPQILTGDMNSDSLNKAIMILKSAGWKDTYEAVHGIIDPGFTLHHFYGPKFKSNIGKIDWIFVKGKAKPVSAEIIRDSIREKFPSDHFFVSSEIDFKI